MLTTGCNEGCSGTIKDHSGEMLELCRLSNALLPISQLPDVVFAEIFDCYKGLHGMPAEWFNVIRLTHVCHSWRAIACSFGRLWADIYTCRPELVQHWLAHSAYCPLDVFTPNSDNVAEAEGPRSLQSDALCLALDELPRIRRLYLYEVRLTREQLSSSNWLNSPALILQSLFAHASDETYRDLDVSFCLTTLLLCRHLPSLTSLTLIDTRFFLNDASFPQSLRHLTILHLMAGVNYYRLWVILAVLDTLPLLESLHLSWRANGDDATAGSAVERQVTLPRLQKLNLTAHSRPMICACLLDHLTFPSTTKINIRTGHFGDVERDLMLQVVAAKLNGHGRIGGMKHLRHLSMGPRGNVNYVNFSIICSSGNILERAHDVEPDIRIDLLPLVAGPRVEPSFAGIMRVTCNMLPLSKLDYLVLQNVCWELHAEILMAISQNMPALHTIVIRGWSPWAMPSQNHATTVIGDVKELFPKLKQIFLVDLGCCQQKLAFWDLLVNFLTFRKESGVPVNKLLIARCEDDEDYSCHKRLSGLANDFIWAYRGQPPLDTLD